MEPLAEVQNGPRSPRRRAAREPVPAGSPKVKTSCYLSEEAYDRLKIHSVMMRVDSSVLIEKLITEHLRTYVVQNRGKAGVASGEKDPAPEAPPTLTIGEALTPSPSAEGTSDPGAGEGRNDPPAPSERRRRRA